MRGECITGPEAGPVIQSGMSTVVRTKSATRPVVRARSTSRRRIPPQTGVGGLWAQPTVYFGSAMSGAPILGAPGQSKISGRLGEGVRRDDRRQVFSLPEGAWI